MKGRAGRRAALGAEGAGPRRGTTRLFALNRLSGTLARFAMCTGGKLGNLDARSPLFDPLTQPERRTGEVLYYTDVGRTGMSCDACHVDGHVGGLLFSKTQPIRLYRATSVRGSRETPPYFIPPSEQQPRHHRLLRRQPQPLPEPGDERARDRRAGPVCLRDSRPRRTPSSRRMARRRAEPHPARRRERAIPARGARLFFGKAACQSCHPGPLFTTDQLARPPAGATCRSARPIASRCGPSCRTRSRPDFPAQSLSGIWDLFPLLTTGTAGSA